MTKKDYELHADIINVQLLTMMNTDPALAAVESATIMRIARNLADNYGLDNPRFKRHIFLLACVKNTGVDPE